MKRTLKRCLAVFMGVLMLCSLLTIAPFSVSATEGKVNVTVKSRQNAFSDITKTYWKGETFEVAVIWRSDDFLRNGLIDTYLNHNGLRITAEVVNSKIAPAITNISQECQEEWGLVTINFSILSGMLWSTDDYIVKYTVEVLDTAEENETMEFDFVEVNCCGELNENVKDIGYIKGGEILEENKDKFQLSPSLSEPKISNTKVALVGSFSNWIEREMTQTAFNSYSITIDLEPGTYEFKIVEDEIWMGADSSITDMTDGVTLSGTADDCTLNTTGGTYTFVYNVDADSLVVTYDKPMSKNIVLSGDFNVWDVKKDILTQIDDYVYATTIELKAGTYQFKIVEDKIWMGNEGTIKDTTQTTSDDGWTFAKENGNCKLQAIGGTYTFEYNTDTHKVIVLWTPAETEPTAPSSSETEPTEHQWDEGTVTLEPSCDKEGEIVYNCPLCGEEKTEELEALGHDFSKDFTVDKKATCTQEGSKSRHCSRCDAVTDVTVIQKDSTKGHTVVIDKAVAPTCKKSGLTKGKHCAECNQVLVKQNTIKATGHKNIKKLIYYVENGYEYEKICMDCHAVISKGSVYKMAKVEQPFVKIKSGNNKITVNYKKTKGATGFQVKYIKGNTTVIKTYNLNKSVKKVIKVPEKGTYKVKVRAFVKHNNKKYYGSWTKVKKVKVI